MDLKILIVDDSDFTHRKLTEYLSKLKLPEDEIEIIHCYNTEEFKSIFQPDNFALVITDLVMEKELSGIDVINYIRHISKDERVRILLMTEHPEKVPQELLMREYDVNGYIEKQSIGEFSIVIQVRALLKAYKDMLVFENAVRNIEDIFNVNKPINIEALINETLYQIRSLLTIKDPNLYLEINALIKGNLALSIPDNNLKLLGGEKENYEFENEILGKDIKVIVTTSRKLNDFEIDYIKTSIESIKYVAAFSEISNIQNEIIYKLANIIEARSGETANHVKRVSEIVYILSEDVIDNSQNREVLRIASALHDIGKIGIPDHILNKPGKLSSEEFAIMKEHPMIGFEILKNSKWKVFELGAVISLQHHERWDGTGYPYGLYEDETILEARIVQVADVFEALTHDRCYRPAWPVEKAIEYMHDMKGKQFDPNLIEIFDRKLPDILDLFEKLK